MSLSRGTERGMSEWQRRAFHGERRPLDSVAVAGCSIDNELLSAFFDDELAPAVHRTVSAHVASCSHCTATLNAFEQIRALLRLSLHDRNTVPAVRPTPDNRS